MTATRPSAIRSKEEQHARQQWTERLMGKLSYRTKRWIRAGVASALAIALAILILPGVIQSTDTRFIGILGVTFSLTSVLWLLTGWISKQVPQLAVQITMIQFSLMAVGVFLTYWALWVDQGFQKVNDLLLTSLVGIVLAVALLLVVWASGPWRPFGPWPKVLTKGGVAQMLASRLSDSGKRELIDKLTQDLDRHDNAEPTKH